jgi:hypothetical protein
MSQPEALPYPFCHSGGNYATSNGDGNEYVECDYCGASGPSKPYQWEAIEAWNGAKR